MTNEQAEEQLRKEAYERERLHIKQQEDWYDSREYRTARAEWFKGPNFVEDQPFEKTREYANARFLYRKRVNGGGDGNDG